MDVILIEQSGALFLLYLQNSGTRSVLTTYWPGTNNLQCALCRIAGNIEGCQGRTRTYSGSGGGA
jgi:hypothetical protein